MNSHRLMIVAGEASGDAHAASLVEALRAVEPETRFDFFGATGPLMRAAGVESIVNSDDLSILGLLEIGRALPKFWRAYKLLKQAALERKPDAVILVDWPDFKPSMRDLNPDGSRKNRFRVPDAGKDYLNELTVREFERVCSDAGFELARREFHPFSMPQPLKAISTLGTKLPGARDFLSACAIYELRAVSRR